MSVFVSILEEGKKAPKVIEEEDFSKLVFTKKNKGLEAKIGDETTLKGKPLKDAHITVVTEGEEETSDIYLKNKSIINSEFEIIGGGNLNLDVQMKSGNPNGKGKSVFANNDITASDANDSIKFSKARFFGNTIDLGQGEDSITFGGSDTKVNMFGENVLHLGDDDDTDIVKFNTANGNIDEMIANTNAKFVIKNFGEGDIFRIKNLDTDEVVDYTQDDLKNGNTPNDYFEFEFLD